MLRPRTSEVGLWQPVLRAEEICVELDERHVHQDVILVVDHLFRTPVKETFAVLQTILLLYLR